jgi:3-deoxy-D-arabino-heptulosonate 7-phosphate (DAHP) synthase
MQTADQLVQGIIDANQDRLVLTLGPDVPMDHDTLAARYLHRLMVNLAQSVPGVTDYLTRRLEIIQLDVKRIVDTQTEFQ